MLEVSVHANDCHCVGGVAVVPPDRPVTRLTHAVTNLGQVEFVQQVLVEAGVLVDCVVLTITITWHLCWPVVKLNLVAELDLMGSSSGTIAVLDLIF